MANPFKLERDMMDPVEKCLPAALGLLDRPLSLLRTPLIGNIIPDVLIANWQEGAVCLRRTLTNAEAALIAALQLHNLGTVSWVTEALFVSASSAERYISKLKKAGLLVDSGDGHFALHPEVRTDCCEIVAVEVKMKRWKEALQQAISYQAFADYSYVVLDAAQIDLREQIFSAYEAANVGLLVQDGEKLLRALRCRPKQCTTGARVIALQKLCQLGSPISLQNTHATSGTQTAILSDVQYQYA